MAKHQAKHAVVLFDGVCNLCNNTVQIIIKNDPEGYFRFASLQSDAGIKLLNQFKPDVADLDSIVLIEENKMYRYSTAALKIARHLKGGWQFFYPFIFIPAFIRDAIYRVIARNRYKWWGRRDSCMLPGPGIAERFL